HRVQGVADQAPLAHDQPEVVVRPDGPAVGQDVGGAPRPGDQVAAEGDRGDVLAADEPGVVQVGAVDAAADQVAGDLHRPQALVALEPAGVVAGPTDDRPTDGDGGHVGQPEPRPRLH